MKKELFLTDWYFNEFPLNTSFETMNSSGDLYPVDLPHDWMIYHVKDLYKNSIGFYKKTFTCNPEDGHTYIVRFEGVYMDSHIYLNGKDIFEWKYGYSTFDVDLTPYLVNGSNTICVSCTYQSPNSRWYSGAGIYRNVYLIEQDYAYLPLDGVYISTSKEQDDFTVTIDTEAKANKSLAASIRHSVLNSDGVVICTSSNDLAIDNELSIDSQSFVVKKPCLWDIESPYMYSVITELVVNSAVIDSVTNPLGFRTINFDPDKGFFLNDRSVKINGVCQHHDLGCLGAAMNKVALRRQFDKLIKMGVNSIRTSHNMPATEVMELADELGILIFSESFDMWELPKTTYDYGNYFPTWYDRDVTSWVRRDRNHPSLFIWSIGNEIYDTHAGTGYKWTILLRDAVRKLDYRHNAYIGIGSNYIEWDNAQKCSNELELSGYNYGERLYDAHHKKYPDWCIFGSETSSTVQSRGIYHFPYEIRILTYEDGQCSCLGNCTTNWGAKNAAAVIADHRDRDFVFGQYLWTGWDYIGEPTPFHSKNSFFGQIDTAGFEKDTYYQYQAEWSDVAKAPMVHLLPYWDFNDGQTIDVCAYSNAPYVELFLNGKSQGRQFIDHKTGRELQGHWKLPYTKGELVVKASDENGNVVAIDSARSFDDPAYIAVKTDKNTLNADGRDLIFAEISLEDKNHVYVANAKNRVSVSVSGAAKLVGLDNGDSTDYEEYKGNNRRLFSGKLLAVLQSTGEVGDITITVSSKDLPSNSVILNAKACDQFPFKSVLKAIQYPYNPDDVPVRKIELTNLDSSHLTKENPTARVRFNILPLNATYKDVQFKALTKDAVIANYAKVSVSDNIATVTALGDGEFILTAFAYNDKDHPEIISTLNFDITGCGLATHDAYELVPGIQFKETHSSDSKLSFLGGVFLPARSDGPAYATYENIDLGEFGSDEVHVPIFSFHDELPIEIYEGSLSDGKLLCKDIYRAKSIYNTYQENAFKLSRRVKGTVTLTFAFEARERFSMQGFYFTKLNKTYETLSALDNTRITGDSFTIESDSITSIGNNVCLEYENMDFDKGLSGIKIVGKSTNPITSLHILFEENGHKTKQLIEVPGSKEYKESSFNLSDTHIKGKVSLLFLPGSNFDLKEFKFNETK